MSKAIAIFIGIIALVLGYGAWGMIQAISGLCGSF